MPNVRRRRRHAGAARCGRTYAAWVRTGLVAMASGIGAKALLIDLFPMRPAYCGDTRLHQQHSWDCFDGLARLAGRQEQNFYGQRPGPEFGISRWPETDSENHASNRPR